MAYWRLKALETFPRLFHEALMKGEGDEKVLARRLRKEAAVADRLNWNIFRYNVRQGPPSALRTQEESLIHCTRIAYNPDLRMWELLLTSRRKVMEEIVSIE
jgi:hypothetical protein